MWLIKFKKLNVYVSCAFQKSRLGFKVVVRRLFCWFQNIRNQYDWKNKSIRFTSWLFTLTIGAALSAYLGVKFITNGESQKFRDPNLHSPSIDEKNDILRKHAPKTQIKIPKAQYDNVIRQVQDNTVVVESPEHEIDLGTITSQLIGLKLVPVSYDLRKLDDLHPKSLKGWDLSKVKLRVDQLSGIPAHADPYISTNNRYFEKLAVRSRISIEEYKENLEDVLYIKLVSRTSGQEYPPLVLKGYIRPVLQELFSDLLYRNLDTLIHCRSRGCSIKSSHLLCGMPDSRIELGRKRDSMEFIYDLEQCPNKETYREHCSWERLCIPSYDIFPMAPGEKIWGSLKFKSKTLPFQIQIPLTIAGDINIKQPGWIKLKHAPNVDASKQPMAIIRYYSRIRSGLQIILAYGWYSGIDAYNTEYFNDKALFDVDGLGFLPPKEKYGIPAINIPYPSSSVISLKPKLSDGREIGPFSYLFDADELKRATVSSYKIPSLSCVSPPHYYGKKRDERLYCSGSSNDWLKVKEIRYGNVPDKPFEVQKVRMLNAGQILGKPSAKPREELFNFPVPEGWKNLYYKYLLYDGSETEIRRINFE